MEPNEELEKYRMMDSTLQGRDKYFMLVDSYISEGNPTACQEDFGPVMHEEAPPTLNGKME